MVLFEAHNSKELNSSWTFNQHAIRSDQMIDLDIKEHIQANLLLLVMATIRPFSKLSPAILQLQETMDRLSELTNDKIEGASRPWR